MEDILNTVFDVSTNQDFIKKEIFSYFKVIPNTESDFIRKAKTIVCYEIHLPFSLELSEGYNFKIISREQFFMYSENSRHDHMSSIMKCYGFFKQNWDKVTKTDKDSVIQNSIDTINDIIKITKSKFGNTNLFLLNSANRDYVDMLFTYSVNLKTVSHGGAVINIDSIYHPTHVETKPMFTSDDEYNYLLSKLEEPKLDRIIDTFYYLCLAKESELEKDFNAAIINMQTGIEIFMYDIFNKLVAEGICNKPNGNIFYKNLIIHHLKPVLETEVYLFDIDNKNSFLYYYWNNLYLLRNKVVHNGYVLSYNEYTELTKPACDNLIKVFRVVLKEKYPNLYIGF